MAWRAWDLKSPRPLSIDCLHSLSTSPAQTGSHARYYNTLYLHPTYEAAKKKLNLIKRELAILNQSDVRSPEEGMEETLALHHLGIFPKLGVSFKTTNCIENIMRNVIKVVCEALFNFN